MTSQNGYKPTHFASPTAAIKLVQRAKPAKGLTLLETLISLAILSLITVAASQALQRASILKDKIDVQSETLQAQFTLEQLISRDILNSETLTWPSSHCDGLNDCFVLQLKNKVFSDIENEVSFIRYRFENKRLYRDQASARHDWQSAELTRDIKHVSFEFFKHRLWQRFSDISYSTATNGSATTLNNIRDDQVRALRIHWHPEGMPSYQQTVMLP